MLFVSHIVSRRWRTGVNFPLVVTAGQLCRASVSLVGVGDAHQREAVPGRWCERCMQMRHISSGVLRTRSSTNPVLFVNVKRARKDFVHVSGVQIVLTPAPRHWQILNRISGGHALRSKVHSIFFLSPLCQCSMSRAPAATGRGRGCQSSERGRQFEIQLSENEHGIGSIHLAENSVAASSLSKIPRVEVYV